MKDVTKMRQRKAELDDAYYNRGEQLVSDEEYDVLKRRLDQLEGEQPVGAEVRGAFKKFRRDEPMLSLQNAFTEQDVEAWLKTLPPKTSLFCQLKYDGVALELRYAGGRLVTASTRGNGIVGEDVTENARTMRGVPDDIFLKEEFVVRGEVVVPRKDFDEYNEEHPDAKLSSPRSMAVGSLKQKDPAVTASRPLVFVLHSLAFGDEMLFDPDVVKELKDAGFVIANSIVVPEYVDLPKIYKAISDRREELEYEADGMVIKVTNISVRSKLGESASFPRWALAWKFKAQRAETVLRKVEWRVGRTGKVVPRATFDPVVVAGAELRHASLHSQGIINRLETESGHSLRIGSRIVVERSGDVIPYVSELLSTGDGEPVFARYECPSCGNRLTTLGSGELRCEAADCNLYSRLFFAMRTVFGMKGIGPKVLDVFEAAGVAMFSDLFDVTEEQFLSVDGMGRSSWKIYKEAIDRVRREGIPLDVFLVSLGVRGVGWTLAKRIAEKFDCLDSFNVAVGVEDLMSQGQASHSAEWLEKNSIPGMALETKKRLVEAAFVPAIDLGLKGVKIVPVYEEERMDNGDGPLSGKKVCFTGTLSMPRKEFEALVTRLGGMPVSSVTRDLNFLVVGDKPGSKLEKAKALGIEIRDEAWIREMMG